MTRVRKILVGVGVAVVVVIVGGALALSSIDLNHYVADVEAAAKDATGRELRIKGKIGFTLSLLPTVAAADVSFQNAPWGSRPLLASAKRVEVQIALLPLLTGDLVIRRIALVEPDVLLEVNAKGDKNWVFAPAQPSGKKAPEADRGRGIDVRRIEIRDGLLTYRQAKPRLQHKARIETLELDAARGFDALEFDGRLLLNDVRLVLEGQIDNLHQAGKPGATSRIALQADVGGNALRVDGRVPLAAGAPVGLDARFAAELKDAATLRKLLQQPVPALPASTLRGRASMKKEALEIEDFVAEVGKSRANGSLRLELEGARRAFAAKLDAPLIDLQELYAVRKALGGAAGQGAGRDGRIFSSDPFPLAALQALDGDARLRVEKLRLADGNVIDDVRAHTRFKQGKIDSDELTLRLQGRELKIDMNADASSGKTLAVNATLAGAKVPLAALSGLLGITPPPEGSPTDIAVKFSGRGGSMRALMASANGDVRIVVGPGRIKNRAIDVGADVTELLNALNPTRSQDPYTQVKCAVLRFPVRNGIATISNGIAVETSRVRLIGGGTVNLRNETLELGFRPEAASGLGVGAGNLAQFAKVEGTLANPRVGLDMASTATAAAAAGAAVVTGGLSLLAGGLLIDTVPDNPCQVALSGVAPKQKSTVDKVLDPIKKLFGN
jgi:uncharacterized protein involved in outer membrane biogenesis